eukprot:s2032_g18.t1
MMQALRNYLRTATPDDLACFPHLRVDLVLAFEADFRPTWQGSFGEDSVPVISVFISLSTLGSRRFFFNLMFLSTSAR